VEVLLHAFLTLALDGGELSASGPGHLSLGNSPWYPLGRGGWVGRRVGLDASEKSKILTLVRYHNVIPVI
jgi:hypothetical protein